MNATDDSGFTPEARRHMVRTPEGTVYLEAAAAPHVPDPAELEETRAGRLHLARICLLMSGGLLLTAAFALVFVRAEITHDPASLGWRLAWNQVLFLAEVALVPFIAQKVPRIAPGVAGALFVSYAVLNGLTFPGLFFWIGPEYVARLFAAAALGYGVLAVMYWKSTLELRTYGGLCGLLLLGISLAVLLMLQAPQLARNSCLVAVPLFLALSLYYDQEIREPYQSFDDDDNGWKASLAAAFFLYFAFVNVILVIQLTIARFLGRDREGE